jgi:hypothetical protein
MKITRKKPEPLGDRELRTLEILSLSLGASAHQIGAALEPDANPPFRTMRAVGLISRLVRRAFVEKQFDPSLNYYFYKLTAAGRSALRGDPR